MGQVGLFVMVEAAKVQNMVHRQPTTMNTTTTCCAIPRQSMAAIMTLLSCDWDLFLTLVSLNLCGMMTSIWERVLLFLEEL